MAASLPAPGKRPKGARGGYTAVEVLMAMTIMGIGAAAVMTMQKASVQGNLDARKTDIANSIARTWVERIQADAMQWTVPGPANEQGASNLALAQVVSAGVANAGLWFLPNQYAALTVPLSPGFDILGRDVSNALLLQNSVFCTHARFSVLDTGLYRVDVRVLWARGMTSGGSLTAAANPCTSSIATSNSPNPLVYHAIYVTTAVKGNPQ